jgi:predicted transposase/invertase (TIGR01784 family)
METKQRLFIAPIRDFIFKQLFGDRNNTAPLVSFLLSVLDLPRAEYEHIELADPELQREYAADKLSVIDLKLYTTSGRVIDIEIQTCDTGEIKQRIVFSTAKALAFQLRSGKAYRELRQVISIQITNFVLLDDEPDDQYHNVILLMNKRSHKVFSDMMELHFLEIGRAHV